MIIRERPRGFAVRLERAFECVWVCLWAIAEYQTARQIGLGLPYKAIPNARLDPEIWLWFIVWSAIGIATFFGLFLLIFAGPETVTLTSDEIIVSTQVGTRKRTWRRRRADIDNLRLEKIGTNRKSYVVKMDCNGKSLAVFAPSDRISTERVLDAMRTQLDPLRRASERCR